MPYRLNQLCADVDRTAAMGLFPHDVVATPLVESTDDELVRSVDADGDATERDQSLWRLVYEQTAQRRTRELPDLLYTIATEAREAVLRRSASWALLKVGEVALLGQTLRSDDDGNIHSWKQHLIYESQGRTDWVDPRPVRAVDSPYGYSVTLPLTIHGIVQFRTFDGRVRQQEYRIGPSPYGGGTASTAQTAPASSVRSGSYGPPPSDRDRAVVSAQVPDPGSYEWHSLVAGPITQARMVGNLTAAVGAGSFYDNLTIQKVCTDAMANGLDHVQGYLFRGMSRSLGGNAMAHYYSSSGLQPYYLSGRIADASEGVIDVETQLTRHAETNIVTKAGAPYPYVQSVRGLFHGPARMNPALAADPQTPPDNYLQIVRDPYANGWFFGEFRSVPVDVDGDDQVELNGMEMYTDLSGTVHDRTPRGPQPSLRFAR